MKAANKLQQNKSPSDPGPKKSCLSEIQRLQRERDERRRLMEQAKLDRAQEEQRNRENGTPGDIDFQRMIKVYRETQAPREIEHSISDEMKICICVRKRPINTKEIKRKDYDSVTCSNPLVVVHDCKMKVDGISKYLDNASFEFDHTFHEDDSTDDVYACAIQQLVRFTVGGGRSTVFAYGQTGSGKTYTMQGVQKSVAEDLFALLEENDSIHVYVSYFEIYGGRCQDLLNSRQRLNVREDGFGEVVVSDLLETKAESSESLWSIIETGNRNRTTHSTESNDESSRSHAICQITLRTLGRKSEEVLVGRFSLIDLAGSERGADTKSHNRQRRMEGAEINKSLLALKECIRALDSGSSHVPYRASKLTLVLKDSFTNKKSRTVMIATVSPAASSADHTINTLRYADRIKERVVGGQQAQQAQFQPQNMPAAPANVKGPANGKVHSDFSSPETRLPAAPPAVDEGNFRAPVKSQSSANRDKSNDEPSQRNYNNNNKYESPSYKELKEKEKRDLYSDDEILFEGDDAGAVSAFHRTVQDIFEQEEDLLNLHMSVIQENAELLTEEGRLLQQMQSDNNDIDAYAMRLESILGRKQELIDLLQSKLNKFRNSLQREENFSKHMASGK